jgi:hypothetical protein
MNPHKIAFLFGAGASFGAGHTTPSRPPLGVELYDALASQYPGNWGPDSRIGRRYAAGLRADFEKTVSNEICMCEPALNVLEWNRDVAAFFAQFSLDGTNLDLYTQLLEFLRTAGMLPDTIFTSINYDCLLEQAAAGLGISVGYGGAPEKSSDARILKIHGSCNFVTPDLSGWIHHLTNPGSFLECAIEILPTHNLRQALQFRLRPQLSVFPVLSLYAFGKPTQAAGGQIQQIRNAWLEESGQATHLVIIGVRCNRDDKHITEGVIGTGAGSVLFVGGTQDFEGWRSLNPKCQHVGDKFQESFEAVCQGVRRNP